MYLSLEAIIAIVGLGLALPPSVAIVWKCRRSALQALAASQDVEVQVIPSTRSEEQPELQAVPAQPGPPPVLTRVPLNASTKIRLFELRRLIIVDMYRELASRLCSSQEEAQNNIDLGE